MRRGVAEENRAVSLHTIKKIGKLCIFHILRPVFMEKLNMRPFIMMFVLMFL